MSDKPTDCITTQRPAVRPEGIPYVDQDALNPSTSGHGSTLESKSHAITMNTSAYTKNDADGRESVYSYNSSRDLEQFVINVFGRNFNSLCDTYLLPSDKSEWNRLDKQFSAHLMAMRGLYPCADIVEALLVDDQTQPRKQILDLGCGTGQWAIEMAQAFPHVDVKGVDLAPTPIDPSLFPPNLQFEIDDINRGLDHFYNAYDFVHVKCIMTGITDPERSILEFQKCLKPGGLLVMIDGDKDFLNTTYKRVKLAKLDGDEDVDSVSEQGSMFLRIVWEAHEASKIAGSALERGIELIDLGLWDSPLMDPSTAVVGSVYLPATPWPITRNVEETQALRYVGVLMRQVFQNIHRAYHAILLKHGMDQTTLDEWSKRSDKELENHKPKMWTRLRVCWARKKGPNNTPAPPFQTNSNSSSLPGGSTPLIVNSSGGSRPHPYPPPTLLFTRDEAAAARRERVVMDAEWPTSAVWRAKMAQGL